MFKGFVWSVLILLSVFALAWLCQLLRFVIKRVILSIQIRRVGYRVRSLRPLWWLIDFRNHCELLLETPDMPTKVLAVKLIPSVIAAVNGKLSGDDAGLIETLENIFGEDNVEACKDAVKNSGAELA